MTRPRRDGGAFSMPRRTRVAGPGAWCVQGFGVSLGHSERGRRGDGGGATWGAPERNGTERRGGDMATRFIGGISAKGLPEIEGAVPAAGGGCR